MKYFVAASALVAYANAFWGAGHLLGKSVFECSIITNLFCIVARRAQEILEQSNPAALQQALNVLAALK